MKELLTYIIQSLVDHPDQVSVTERKADGETVYEVRVADGDMGKVIGRQGRIVKQIRILMRAVAQRKGKPSASVGLPVDTFSLPPVPSEVASGVRSPPSQATKTDSNIQSVNANAIRGTKRFFFIMLLLFIHIFGVIAFFHCTIFFFSCQVRSIIFLPKSHFLCQTSEKGNERIR